MIYSQIKYKNVFSPVDIVIPYYSHYHLLGECLESILTKTFGAYYTITLVDDGSPNKDFLVDMEKHKLKKIPLQYLRHENQQGFGAALRKGFENTINDWVLFLHADCRIEQTDWLISMLQTMQNWKMDGVKLVHAKVNDGGTGAFAEDVLGSLERRNDIVVNEPLPLICALVHRQLFEHIGGFIKSYPYLGYEDEELFWRMKLHNYKQVVCGTSFVYHHGGTVAQELMKDQQIRTIIEENQSRFTQDIQELYKKMK